MPVLFLLLLIAGGAPAQIQFVDVARQLGIDFVHTNGATPEKMLPETAGSGSAFFDWDTDGDLDLYLVNSGQLVGGRKGAWNALYRNDGERFVDLAEGAGARGGGVGMGVAAADYDNDGDPDLYLSNWGSALLLRNDGERFADATRQAGLSNTQWGSSAAFFDYDLDGDLDLFAANYVVFRAEEQPWCGRRDMNLRFYCDPRVFQPSADLLFRNEGDGTFADVSKAAGIVHRGNGLGVVAGDFDGDGDGDVYVANDLTPNFLYENRGNGTFEEIGLLAGVALSADGASQAGMGVDAGDADGDGDLDLFVTNYQLEPNNLYRNDGRYFTENSFKAGIGESSLNYLGFGTGYFDYDNDGDLDLFVANGHIHDNIEQYDRIATYAQQAQILRNEGRGRYVELTAHLGPALQKSYVGRGSSFGDWDQDGDLDIALVDNGRPFVLLRNDGGRQSGHWLQVDLQGRKSNRDGVGAKLWLRAGSLQLYREVKAGSGYLSTSQISPFFGLGENSVVDRLEIHWPGGGVQVLEKLPVDRRLRVVEGD